MARKREYKVDKVVVQISKSAHEFFMMKKRYHEPMYSVIDRWVELSLHDREALEERITKQAKVIEIYHDRIKDMERNPQTRLPI